MGARKTKSNLPFWTTNPTAQNNTQANDLPYIFSEDMRTRLGNLESSGNYGAHSSGNGGIGALGKYQMRAADLLIQTIWIKIING